MPSLPFLVTTRMIAGFVAVIPLYVLGLLSSYLATRTIATVYFGQSTGTYDYYFHLFLPPGGRAVVVRQGAGVQRDRGAGPLLLRLHRHRRAGRRRRGRRPGRAAGDRRASTSSTSSCRWPSGARPRPCGSRGERPDAAGSSGVAFVALLGGALTLSVLPYRKAFTPVTWVTLRADHTGLQLNPGADVKLRGVVVGEVRDDRQPTGSGARLRLALDPDADRRRSRPTSAPGCCPRRCSASGTWRWCRRPTRPAGRSATAR